MTALHRLLWVAALTGSLCLIAQADSNTQTPWFSSASTANPSDLKLSRTIRVGLLHSRHTITLGSTGSYSYVSPAKGKVVTLSAKKKLLLKGSAHGLVLEKKVVGKTLQVTPRSEKSFITVNGRAYRGMITLQSRSSGVVDVVEHVELEEYLYGVLPREVGVDWPAESLKSQAVVSRTFVIANLGKYNDRGYDVSNDVYSQVYGGLEDENPASNQAVDATRGEILLDQQGTPIQAFFHSSCGGHTENPAYVWKDLQNAPDYLEGVRDKYCKDDPFDHWRVDISGETLRKRLKRRGFKVGEIKKIRIEKKSPSKRAWVFRIDSSQGRTLIPGNAFRMAVGPEVLRSTLLSEIQQDKKIFHFEGSGWGHGVGLCQWGARGRALAGESYEKILSAYYPHTSLVKTRESDKGEPHG